MKQIVNLCIDKNCNAVIFSGKYQDGIRCPRCDGPIMPQPYEPNKYRASKRALYVRRQIIERCKKHCFDLTPEQIDTVLSLGDKYEDLDITTRIDEQPLLNIQLADIDSVPTVFYKGEEINNKIRVSFDYRTKTDEYFYPSHICIEHADTGSKGINTKTIQHNQPINDVIVNELMESEGIQCCGKHLTDHSTKELIDELSGRQEVNISTMGEGAIYAKVFSKTAKSYTIIINSRAMG